MEKVAIIDLGSNSARLVIFQILDGGYFTVIDEIRESVRLGQDMERDGFLKRERADETIKTLKMFRKLCDAHKVDKIMAVATAAVRRAKNQRGFLDEVSATCGIQLKVLSDEEESNYVYQGVINSIDYPRGIIMEIGGGSTKIIHYNRRNILNYATLPFGAVTLTDLFKDDGISSEKQTEKIEEFFTEQLKSIEWLSEVQPETCFIGVGGSFRNLCKVSKMVKRYPLDIIHNYNVSLDEFNHIYDMIRVLDLDKKKKIKGLSSDRADILPSALAVVKSFMGFMNFDNITISGSGLREGMMLNYSNPQSIDKPVSDVLNYSLNTLIKMYGTDTAHVENTVNLAIQLFKQLRVLHKFPRQYAKILKIAASLHDTGLSVKFYNSQKHSWYIILNSNIYGVSHREIVLAAFVVAEHKKSNVCMGDWTKYKDLVTEEDLDVVKKLGVILRLAESLERTRTGVVKSIDCDILGDSVIMKTVTEGDATLEIKEAELSIGEFRKAFRKNLSIL